MTAHNPKQACQNPTATPLNKLRSLVIAKAQSDPKFLELLKKDPHKAMELCGFSSLPKDVKIHVVSETPQERWLVIPCLDLDAVSGGYNLCTVQQIAVDAACAG